MKRRAVFLLCVLLVAGFAQAQVFKCKDAQGKVVYSDQPCGAAAEPMKLQTAPKDAPARGDDPNLRALRILQAENRLKNPPAECKFKYYRSGDQKGKVLAEAAKTECLRNIDLKEDGRDKEISKEHYNAWRDHYQIESANRNAEDAAASAAIAAKRPMHCKKSFLGGMDCQ